MAKKEWGLRRLNLILTPPLCEPRPCYTAGSEVHVDGRWNFHGKTERGRVSDGYLGNFKVHGSGESLKPWKGVPYGVFFIYRGSYCAQRLLRAALITSGPDLLGRLVCLWVCSDISWFYRRGNGGVTEASLASYFDRKNVRTTFQVRKVPLIKDL